MSEKLRSKLIRLAHSKPELREHLLPLITKSAGIHYDRWETWNKLLKRHNLSVEIEKNPMFMYRTELKIFRSHHKEFLNVDPNTGDIYATVGYDKNGEEFTVHTGNKSSGFRVGFEDSRALREYSTISNSYRTGSIIGFFL